MNAFGIELLDLPGSWPTTRGEPRRSLRWRLNQRAFVPSPRWWFRETDDGLIVHFEEEGEYRLRSGPEAEVSVTLGPKREAEAALAFLVSVIPLALPLFDLEPFHGTALETSRGSALLVLGHADSGKSTTATALRELGLGFLADDACALDVGGRLWPGPPLLSVHQLGASDDEFAVYDGKSIVAVDGHDASSREVSATAILRPEAGASLGVTPQAGRGAIEGVLAEVRAPRVMPGRREELQVAAAAGLARGPVGLVSFDKRVHPPREVGKSILDWMGDV